MSDDEREAKWEEVMSIRAKARGVGIGINQKQSSEGNDKDNYKDKRGMRKLGYRILGKEVKMLRRGKSGKVL